MSYLRRSPTSQLLRRKLTDAMELIGYSEHNTISVLKSNALLKYKDKFKCILIPSHLEAMERRAALSNDEPFDVRRAQFFLQHSLHVPVVTVTNLSVQPGERGFVMWLMVSAYFPLISACLAPLANLVSFFGLLQEWRYDPVSRSDHSEKHPVLPLNILAFVVGILGNVSLMLNFSGFFRYSFTQCVSITCWILAASLLMAAVVVTVLDHRPRLVLTEGFWLAVFTVGMYYLCSLIMLFNYLGYWLQKYPATLNLTKKQRSLMSFTISFCVWQAVSAIVMSKLIPDLPYGSSLYYCTVSMLTIGLGDVVPRSAGAKVYALSFSFVGVLIMGLIVSVLRQVVLTSAGPSIFWHHVEINRLKALEKMARQAREAEIDEREGLNGEALESTDISKPKDSDKKDSDKKDSDKKDSDKKDSDKKDSDKKDSDKKDSFQINAESAPDSDTSPNGDTGADLDADLTSCHFTPEADPSFAYIREIRRKVHTRQSSRSLLWTVVIFISFSLLGALVFSRIEKWNYFNAVYFCFLCLLTIGYGDFHPETRLGRVFFIIWAIAAVPLMTILVSNAGDQIYNMALKVDDLTSQALSLKTYAGLFSHAFDAKEHEPQAPPLQKQPTLVPSTPAQAQLYKTQEIIKSLGALKKLFVNFMDSPEKQYDLKEWQELLEHFEVHDLSEENFWMGEYSPLKLPLKECNYLLMTVLLKMSKDLKELSEMQSQDPPPARNASDTDLSHHFKNPLPKLDTAQERQTTFQLPSPSDLTRWPRQ